MTEVSGCWALPCSPGMLQCQRFLQLSSPVAQRGSGQPVRPLGSFVCCGALPPAQAMQLLGSSPVPRSQRIPAAGSSTGSLLPGILFRAGSH